MITLHYQSLKNKINILQRDLDRRTLEMERHLERVVHLEHLIDTMHYDILNNINNGMNIINEEGIEPSNVNINNAMEFFEIDETKQNL